MLCEDEHNKDQLHFFGRETLDFVLVFFCTTNCVAKQMEHYEILYVLCPSAGKTWIHPFDCQNQNLLWLWLLSHYQSGGEGMKALFNIDWLFFFQRFGENGENEAVYGKQPAVRTEIPLMMTMQHVNRELQSIFLHDFDDATMLRCCLEPTRIQKLS